MALVVEEDKSSSPKNVAFLSSKAVATQATRRANALDKGTIHKNSLSGDLLLSLKITQIYYGLLVFCLVDFHSMRVITGAEV